MNSKINIKQWTTDAQALFIEVNDYFATYPSEVQTLAPLWVIASYFDKELAALGGHRCALGQMLKAVPSSGREEFLSLLRNMVHPRFRPLIDWQLAKLPGKAAQN